ncbi:epidermal retinol dehydrogenase 2-like isoform X2 [Acipenser oxyrinchus oxyrinchus]|uniref:Epidermal retinol dehydrogenase 2-like isoform X2 n=1 Tax=Acipenser oxyrinchus oxyrinchus TaxID=40147 RepID=A0AAD8G9Q2_ACIOX|nr:epidermal retinol dehydrogenase 2-like isoform X2 [Acipenser oxyrinchus oxyrinchus]
MHNLFIYYIEKAIISLKVVKELFYLTFGTFFYVFEAFARLLVHPPRKDVEGEIVLVTGAARGIGKLIAEKFGMLGATLVLWDNNLEAIEQTTKELRRSLDVRVYAYVCDCSRRTEVYKVAEMVKREVGDVSILVNNAGVVTGKYNFTDAPDNLVDRTLRVNAAAHFWTYKAFLPTMMARNHGHLVCIACHGGLFAMNGLADYCASKFAAVGFAESIALELLVLGKEGVKTTIACPYLINTTMFAGCQTKWPSFLPVTDQHDAAEKIVDAILREKLYTLLPFSLYFLMALKSVMPTKLGIIFVNFLGSLDLMDQFSGVPVSPAASCRKTQEPAQLPKEETNLKQTAGNISEYN